MASPGKKAFLLRVEPALWEQVEQLAAQELRSVNAQVEFLLRVALARRGRAARTSSPGRSAPVLGGADETTSDDSRSR